MDTHIHFVAPDLTNLLADLGDRLGQLRHRRGLTQRDAAAAVGIAGPYISLIESAKREASISTIANLVALYAPEHGIDGTIGAGIHVSTRRDSVTGLTIHSLYGPTRKPTPAMLAGIDVLVFDLQDIGCRSYTYISTMIVAMEAAAENGKQFVVLDRPNPLGGWRVYVEPMPPRPANLPQWIEFGTKKMQARPFLFSSARLEEGAHVRRISEALTVAIEEQGLGE